MKKIYKLQDLDCANCAAKMENAIAKIEGVSFVSISYMAQKMALEVSEGDFDAVLKKIQKTIKKIEPDCRIIL